LKLSDFDYTLPKELIAQYPLKERDTSRLLVVHRKNNSIEHRIFKDITDYLCKDDLLILNDTKVLPSRIIGRRASGGKVEILLLHETAPGVFKALVKPARLRTGEHILFRNREITAVLSARGEVTFSCPDRDRIYALGCMPLPPYIKREVESEDSVSYQTVYARQLGALAAPTAGLHFTEGLLGSLQAQGVALGYVTLHVGYATFKPVKTEEIAQHKMEHEYFSIGEETIALLEKTRALKGRIIAVGTTSCRSLETFALGRKEGETNLFIYPGYAFRMVDCLLTNFHLPRTTLYLLVCAFAGQELIRRAYSEAIRLKYRFYSYGDAMLIL
jgi:S-adenosylmethionine:tRNA ribosyltransferase-isomerase